MAIPIGAVTCGDVMDPEEVLDFLIDARGEMAGTADGPTEFISDVWQLAMSAEGAAAGVEIRTNAGRSPVILLSSGGVQFWLGVNPAMQANTMFQGAGVAIPMTLEWDTTNVPARTLKRTFIVQVRVK